MAMKKQGAFGAWKMLVMALPKGIATFVVAVVGLCVSLPLSVVLIGLPLLLTTVVLCRRMMEGEAKYAEGWYAGTGAQPGYDAAGQPSGERRGWLSLLSPLKEGRSYRGILYSLFQLPIGIAAFTTAIVLPVTFTAVMLSPLAYEVSMRMFDFNLFSQDWALDRLFEGMTSAQRSWIAGGVGLFFVLLLPLILKMLGRWYAGWIRNVAGPEPASVTAAAPYPREPFGGEGFEGYADDAPDTRLHA